MRYAKRKSKSFYSTRIGIPQRLDVMHGNVYSNRLAQRVNWSPSTVQCDSEECKILRNFSEFGDSGIQARVVTVREIPRTRRGKQKCIINELLDGARDK